MTSVSAWQTGTLLSVGVNHHTAAVELRERLALGLAQWPAQPPRVPHLLVQTCNRSEVYAWNAGRGPAAADEVARALAAAAGLTPTALAPHLSIRHGLDALVHVVRVATGLDSLLVGEEQILGQVRSALRRGQETGTSSAPLDGVVSRALEAGRRIRAATMLGRRPSLVSAGVAVALRTPELAEQRRRPAIVLGAGVRARSAAQALLAAEAPVTIVNRTLDHAQRLANDLGHRVRSALLTELPRLLPEAALLVAATASRHPLLDAPMVQTATARPGAGPLVLLDLALPRDIAPAVRGLPRVRLIDLDDLERLCPVDVALRQAEVERAEELAREHARAIAGWLRVRAMSPTIAALRRQGDAIRLLELRRAAPRLADLTPEQRLAVAQLTESIVNKLLHGPTVALRETAGGAHGLDSSQRVFDVLRLDRARHVEPRALRLQSETDGTTRSSSTTSNLE